MVLEFILGVMGTGKTLYMTLKALEFSQIFPEGKIYANYHLNLPNFIYSPFLFLPISELRDCLILADDYYNMKTMYFFITLVSALSRKLNVSLLISAQRFVMIDKTLRELSDFEVKLEYDKLHDVLKILKIKIDDSFLIQVYEGAVREAKSLYDTNEVVELAIPSKLEAEILKWSKTKDDLETNICFYTNNTRKRESLFKKMCEIKGF